MDVEHQVDPQVAPSQEYLSSVRVFPLIPCIKKDVIDTIDSALSWQQLNASDINFAIVRPLVHKYARLHNLAVVFACLVVRSYFISEAESNLAYAGVMLSRANLCEIMAMKLLARFASNHIQLVAALTTEWHPLAGAPPDVVHEVQKAMRGDEIDIDCPQSALEMAISTKAKAFLASPVSQRVVNDMYTGRIVFSMTANNSLLADNYKSRAIELYNYNKSPFLDHYRLRVPRYSAILEFFSYAFLLITFVLCLSYQDHDLVTKWEIAFVLFAAGFTLEEYTACTEHGWIIYIAKIWNVFDFSFIAVFTVYLVLRIKGLITDDVHASDLAFDILSCGACILFPRLAFFAISNNVVILSLRAMMTEFLFFISIASVCFSGLLFTLWTLASGQWTLKATAWLMVQIWFGNTYLSFAQAESFHPVLGPILMTIFAALANTLLLTILISILSNTVARIDANANQEYLYQFSISTIEGVKSDALFSYKPPFNLLAFIILKPTSWIISPRALHSLNVFLIKLTSFPTLVIIGLYERHFSAGQKLRTSGKGAAHGLYNSLPRPIKTMPLFEALVGSGANDLYEAIFEVEGVYDHDLFDESDDDNEVAALRSLASFEGRKHNRISSVSRSTREGEPSSPRSHRRSATRSTIGPGLSSIHFPGPPSPTDVQDERSPLAKLYMPRTQASQSDQFVFAEQAESSLRRVETLLSDIKDLPVRRLKDEMKELQDRQARIENLLLMLTRGMRNEAGPSTPTVPRKGTVL